MLDPAQLAALAEIHRRGSFDRAAAALGVTQSAVSQRLRLLEERVGTVLIRRGQPCRATPAGLRLIRHHDELALMEQALAQDLPGLAAGGAAGRAATLRLAVNADSLATWVLPALAAIPGLLFDLVIDDQEVSEEWLRRGEVLGAVTAGAGPVQGCDSWPLGALRYRATASPAFAARWFAGGVTGAALMAAPALIYSDKDPLQHRWAAGVAGGAVALAGHRLASSHGFVEACRLGLGWGMNPEALVADDLAAGRLVELVPGRPLDVGLHWQAARIAGAALAPVTRAVRAGAAAVLVRPQDARQ
jgi:LysR family transcriptional regulator (chromosome initiation inhibitor)